MKTTQPPLTSDEELAGYRSGAERMREMIERHEADLIAERQRTPTDLAKLDQFASTPPPVRILPGHSGRD
jgi:hypothetical protein